MKISQHCYAITGLFCYPPWTANSGFVSGSEKTLVIDSGYSSHSAATIFGYAQNVKTSNGLILINTEQHLDHIGGNSFFSERGVKIYGHEKINRMHYDMTNEMESLNQIVTEPLRKDLKEGKIPFKNTIIKNPDVKINSNFSIDLGSIKAEVLLTPGHTPSNISIYIPDDGVLFSGDCIVKDYYPNILAGSKPDWVDWIKSLELISSLQLKFVVPGHGEVLEGEKIIKEIARVTYILKDSIERR